MAGRAARADDWLEWFLGAAARACADAQRSLAALPADAAPTAIRDINDLLARGMLTRSEAGGRSTRCAPAEGRGCPEQVHCCPV